MTIWLEILGWIISAGIGGTIAGIIFQYHLNKKLAKYNLINESQFNAFNELWKSLMKLKKKGRDLWEEANKKELSNFVKYIEEAHKSLEENSLILNEKDYENLKKILDQFWYYRIGKERLIDMPNEEIQQTILEASGSIVVLNERQNQIATNESIKKKYERLLEDLRRNFQKKMGIK